ncbi:MAG: hypothetical protein K2X38_01525 [Gemmataceae bacterium]|nr:hypothetical protein [Gemmataceae bacterium]
MARFTSKQVLAVASAWPHFWQTVPLKYVKRTLGMKSVAEVSCLFGVPRPTFDRYVADGVLPGPGVEVRRTLLYTPDAVARIGQLWRTLKTKPKRVSRWSQADVDGMRALWATGVPQRVIAERYGVTQGTVSRLIRGGRN